MDLPLTPVTCQATDCLALCRVQCEALSVKCQLCSTLCVAWLHGISVCCIGYAMCSMQRPLSNERYVSASLMDPKVLKPCTGSE